MLWRKAPPSHSVVSRVPAHPTSESKSESVSVFHPFATGVGSGWADNQSNGPDRFDPSHDLICPTGDSDRLPLDLLELELLPQGALAWSPGTRGVREPAPRTSCDSCLQPALSLHPVGMWAHKVPFSLIQSRSECFHLQHKEGQ